jgi:hypothetical protein
MATRMDLDPTHPVELRESIEFWRRRRASSRWWERGRRREAQAQLERCERELVLAERSRWGPLTPRRALALAGVRPAALRRRVRRVALTASALVLGAIAAGAAVVTEILRALL